MENNLKNKNKSKNVIIGVLIFIIIILIGCMIFIFLNKKDKNNSTSNNENNTNNNTSIKLDNTKDYVYDAEYKTNNKYYKYGFDESVDKIVVNDKVAIKDEIETSNDSILSYKYNSTVQHLEDLKVPYININSEDAKKVNQELEKLYIEYAKNFDNNAEQKDEDGEYYGPNIMCTQVLTYKSFISNKILSIITIDWGACTSQPIPQYHTYNFDLTSGKLLNYKEVLNKLGYNKEQINTDVKDKLKSKITSFDKEYREEECSDNGKKCYDTAYEMFSKDEKENKLLFFVNNQELNLLLIPYYPLVQSGEERFYLFIFNKKS